MGRARPNPRDLGLYLVMVVAWGLNYLAVRTLVAGGGPLWVAVDRAAIGGLAALAFLAVPGERGHLTVRDRCDAMLLGVLNTGAFYALWFVAAAQVPPGETSVLVYTFPLQVAVLAVPVLGYRPSRAELLALSVGLVGIVLVTEPWSGARPDPLAIAALLLAAASWALGTVLYQRRFVGPQLREGNPYQLLGGAGVVLAAAVVLEPTAVPAATPTFLLLVLYLGIVGTAVAYAAWFSLLARLPAATLSSFTFLVPVVALAASAVVTGERLDAVQGAGVVLVAIGLYALGRYAGRRPDPDAEGAAGPSAQSMSGPSP